MSNPILVVGAGLFGQVIAAKLRLDGHMVQVFDSQEPGSGSKPSGGHLKPSWLSFLDRKERDTAFETLDALYGMETLKCQFLTRTVDLMRIDVDKVLNTGKVFLAKVTSIGDGWLRYTPKGSIDSNVHVKGTVIVAAGVWCARLMPHLVGTTFAKQGVSWLFTGVTTPPENLIAPWAPYKQVVRTNHGPGTVWMGDGSAIIPENWNDNKELQIKERILKHTNFPYETLTPQRGMRPYIRSYHQGLQQVGAQLWVATGGGKSGMCLAGVYANKLSEALR